MTSHDDLAPGPEGASDRPTTSFASFGLDPALVEAVEKLGYTDATPIQIAAMPPLLAGRDMIGRARTGSGKTAAFGLPLLHRLRDGKGPVRALVLAPTRELALQVTEALRELGQKTPVRVTTIYGGAPYPPQLKALSSGVPVVVGTPGRVIDHLDRGSLNLSKLEMIVLDEADEMLRMGFFDDVTKIFEAAPRTVQVALFSATMPEPIRKLAQNRLQNPVEIQVESNALSVGHIEQQWTSVPQRNKLDALRRVLAAASPGTTLVFARTRQACADVADALTEDGLPVEALHGDLNQAARERVLQRFRAGRLDIVVATDIAARGLDVDHVRRIINLDLPHDTETYVHRIGRTGRAGREGLALSFVGPSERRKLRYMEQQLGIRMEEVRVPTDHDIAQARMLRVQHDLKAALADESAGPIRAHVSRWLADGTWTAEDLAVAALSRMGMPSGPVAAEVPPPAPAAEARARVQESMADLGPAVMLFLPIGAQRGVRIADLFETFVQGAGVPKSQLGRITVAPRKSFVALPEATAERVLRDHPELNVRGQLVPVVRALPMQRPDHGGGHGPPRGGFKGRGGPRG